MVIWTVLASLTALGAVIILIAYRRMIKKIGRQLSFLQTHKTNMKLTYDLPFAELNELSDRINGILDLMRETERRARSGEDNIKEIITSLSHDIRTPLTSMDGYFQLLAESGTDKERLHYIAIIQGRIKSLKDLLEDLFTFTKLQNESYTLDLNEMDMTKAVYNAVFQFYEDFKSRGIEPVVELSESRLMVQGNAEALHRVFQNILKNALVHGSGGIRILLRTEGDAVLFSCSNTVENPAEMDMTKVFTRFYKADSARTHSSTGLGLSIAKGLVERMDGEISAELEQGVFSVQVSMPRDNSRPNKTLSSEKQK
jgi:signal transduction histidine kinase